MSLRQAAAGGSDLLYLTLLGVGAFGNGPKWVEEAMRRSLALYQQSGLRVRIVHYTASTPWIGSYRRMVAEWNSDSEGEEPSSEVEGSDDDDERPQQNGEGGDLDREIWAKASGSNCDRLADYLGTGGLADSMLDRPH